MSEVQVIDFADNKLVIGLGDNKFITLDFSDCNFNKSEEQQNQQNQQNPQNH